MQKFLLYSLYPAHFHERRREKVKRVRIALAISLIVLVFAVPTTLAAPPATLPTCPPGGITCLFPGDSVNILVSPGQTLERYVFNPGKLTITTVHWDYKNPVFDIWAPDKIWPLRLKEAGLIDDKVPWTGESSACADFEGCTTEWVGGGKFAIGFWYMRIYNPTNTPITMQFTVNGEWLCTAFCTDN